MEPKTIIHIEIAKTKTGKVELFVKSEHDFAELRDPNSKMPSISFAGEKVFKSGPIEMNQITFNAPADNLFNIDENINLSFLLHPKITEGVRYNIPSVCVDEANLRRFAAAVKEKVTAIYKRFCRGYHHIIEIRETRVV